MLGYNESDVNTIYLVSIQLRNAETQFKIDELRKRMDNCDDYQMRDNLARQLKYLKSKLVTI